MASLPLQAMDLTSLKAVLAELRPALLPSRFEKARQADGQTVQLGFRSLTGRQWLEISWLAEAPRLLAITDPPRGGDGSTLAQQLQHGLGGLALVGLEQQGFERVVELQFAPRPGEAIRRSLVVELMGRHSNLFLLDEDRRVVAAGRQVRDQQSRLRPIGTGDPYTPPPPLAGQPPSSRQSEAAWRSELTLLPLPLGRALASAYQGISPALALQLAGPERQQAEALLATPVQELSDRQWLGLWQRWCQWLEAMECERFQVHGSGPTAYACWGASAAAGSGPNNGGDQEQRLPTNTALASHHQRVLHSRELTRRRASLELRLRQALEREQGQRLEQQQRLELVESSERLQRQADALLCLAQPSREQVAEAQGLYRRARRLRRSVEAIVPRLALHDTRIAQLEASLTYLAQGEGEDSPAAATDQLEELLALEEDSEALLRQGKKEPRRRAGGSRVEAGVPKPLELRTPGGLRLQVGRNHRQNDWISLRQARRGDLWFHAQECPGSHVVLKSSEGSAAEPDLQAAADVAAHFSRARDNGRVAVVMVASESLQRIPGAGPGTVRHRGGEVLWADPARARPLLAAPVHSLGRDSEP
jgi:predicted ribosome quality control (RQC) complex YloA/Tae2 family protein